MGARPLCTSTGEGWLVGRKTAASSLSFAAPGKGTAMGDVEDAWRPARTIWKRNRRLLEHSTSMACGSPATSLTPTILSPGRRSRSAPPLVLHCRFQASAAPPGSTRSIRRWRSRPLCDVVMPRSAPSASRRVSMKTNASMSSSWLAGDDGESGILEADSSSDEVIPRTSASETLAAGSGACEGKGNPGMSASFATASPGAPAACQSPGTAAGN
mmetsp:Transcript_24911/g.77624  ORF Transcript_24911/g.77624 Transcript_24911/m.77624 type:complete len:214 (+) Transcript_24911:242-883(+)